MPHGSGLGAFERKNLLSALKKLLPEAPKRLALGIAHVIEQAAQFSADLTALRDKASADRTKETTSATSVVNRQSDLAAAHWGLPVLQTYGHNPPSSLSEHLAAVAEFLKGTSKGGELPKVNHLWFSMLEDLPLRSWQAYWRAWQRK